MNAIDVVSYMDLLFINMANAVLLANNTTPGTITDVNEAIQLLAKKGVMNTSDYWVNLLDSIKYIRVLLMNAANRI